MKYNNVYDVHDVIFLLFLILTQNNQQVKVIIFVKLVQCRLPLVITMIKCGLIAGVIRDLQGFLLYRDKQIN